MDTVLQPHEQRVVDEKRDLDEKIVKLTAFIYGNPTFAGIDPDEQDLLQAQHLAMMDYSDILTLRISGFVGA